MSTDSSKRQYVMDEYPDEEFLFMEPNDFDAAIIGVTSFDPVIVYDIYKIIEILESQGMEYEDALEYFDFNIAGAYMGDKTPIYIWGV
jgi:hypothetical protein